MLKGKSSPYLNRRANKLKRVKKDYQRKALHNPFFQQRRQQKKSHGGLNYIRLTILICLAAGIGYLLFISPVFALKQVKILGVSRVSPDELSARAWLQSKERSIWPFRQSSLLFFKTDRLSEQLMEDFSFDSLKVYKKWPHSIVINAGERDLAFIWRDKNGQSFSDSQGCMIREAPVAPTDLTTYPVLEAADSQERLNSKDCLTLDNSYLQAMFSLAAKLKAYPELKVDRFLLEGESNTLKADLNLGPNILFNVKEDPEKQLNKLVIIKQDKPAADFNRLEYIDLRYGDRAYFK